ncbi:helix-turn-helix domain-containing protein [Brevundimonas sp.]|uniref:helix-turn-helix domain-containing protein n=1 Tax=Brevundimonas sp. TaxID=1871086 RepID=UPI0025C2A516|nr:helix-turn-helix domain-containing protein [Brevundimonas sp.]MCG2663370.1 helix-turn-helix domain-containing protein [Brevundimonas sp.]
MQLVHKEDIKSVIRKRHGSLTSFERTKGLPHGSVKDVLRGRSIARTEAAIAEALKMPIHDVFPRRYGRAESSTKVDNSARKRDAHRLTAGAR